MCVCVCVCIHIEAKRKPWISFISLRSPCFLRSLSRLRGWSVSSRTPPASASQYWDYRHVFIYLGGLGNVSCRYRNCGTWFPSSTMCIPGIELSLEHNLQELGCPSLPCVSQGLSSGCQAWQLVPSFMFWAISLSPTPTSFSFLKNTGLWNTSSRLHSKENIAFSN